MEFLLGCIVGGVIIGVLAHRKPEWFARVVAEVNIVDDKVNDKVK